jgi:hypothetical protein
MLTLNIPNLTQEGKVLKALMDADGRWVSKRHFIEVFRLTQSGRAIYNLENNPKWKDKYMGYEIEHSDFTDEYGFKSYRLKPKGTLF